MALTIKLEDVDSFKEKLWIALGFFDGFHLGHQKIVESVLKAPKDRRSAVFTFSNHPKSVLEPDKSPVLLTPFDEKINLISQTGVDFVIWTDFTKDIASLSAEDFIKSILIDKLNCEKVVVGYNFRFGKNAKGNSDFLLEFGNYLGIDVEILEPVCVNGVPVSSTIIRELKGI